MSTLKTTENPLAIVHEVLQDWLEQNEATDFDENDVAHFFGLLGTAGYSIVPNAQAVAPASFTSPAVVAEAAGWVLVAERLPETEEWVVAQVAGHSLHREPYLCLLRYAAYSDKIRRWCGASGGVPCTATVVRWLPIAAPTNG